jgi:hypothetical protein
MSEDLREVLLRELRQAVADRLADGTHPDEVTADLARRLRRIKQLQEVEARSGSCDGNNIRSRSMKQGQIRLDSHANQMK